MTTISDEWFRGLLTRDIASTRGRIEKGFAELLSTTCRVFLFDEERAGLRLAADGSVWPAGELGGDDATVWRACAGPGPAPEDEAFGAGRWRASLRVAVRDPKGHWLGLVVLKEPPGGADEPSAAAGLLADKAGVLLDNLRTFEAVRGLANDIRHAKSFGEVREQALRHASRLVRADRAEVAYWDWIAPGFVSDLLMPAKDEPLRVRMEVPAPSLIRRVWDTDTGEPLLVEDVDAEPDFHRFHPLTRSKLVIRLDQTLGAGRPPRRLGVLSLDSFAERGFDGQDKEALQLLVRTIQGESFQVSLEVDFAEVVSDLIEPRDFRKTADRILRGVRDHLGFDRAILFRPNYRKRQLIDFGLLGPRPADLPEGAFRFGFDETSVAVEAFRTKGPVFVPDPHDPRLNQRGVRTFGIETSLIAIPLLVGTEPTEPVGVLSVWSDRNPEPKLEDQERLATFGRLAALVLWMAQKTNKQKTFRDKSLSILRKMQTTLDLTKNLTFIMGAVQAVGFDRVRVFRFCRGDTMAPFLQRGMREYRQGFLECNQDLEHPFARHLITNAQRAAQSLLAARVYPNEDVLGDDPDGPRLGKPPGLPWISVPLVSAGRLYGELAADNAYSRRPFDDDDLEHLTVFGELAARAFAIDEKRGMLPVAAMAMLHKGLGFDRTEDFVRRRLLRFLTHHGGGAGFSRALFLEWEGALGAYRFAEGVGQVNEDRWIEIVREVRTKGLEEVLDEADRPGEQCDPDLYNNLRDFSVDGREVVPMTGPFVDCPSAEQAWLQKLSEPKVFGAGRVLYCKVDGPDGPLGLLVVDRKYQEGRTLWDSDWEALKTFAGEAGQVLSLHRLNRQTLELQHDAYLGMINKGLTHELRHFLFRAKGLAFDVAERLGAGRPAEAGEWLGLLRHTLKGMSDRITWLEEFLTRGREEMDVAELVACICREAEKDLNRRGIRLLWEAEPAPSVKIYPGMLRVAVENLLRNAADALQNANGEKLIRVKTTREGRGVRLDVSDTGPGLSEAVKQALKRFDSGVTSRPGEGHGKGLSIVRWAAEMHGGKFVIHSAEGRGARAVLSIMIA